MHTLMQGGETGSSRHSLLNVCAQPVLHRLSLYGELPAQLIQIISRASVRLMDSDMLISQTMHNYEAAEQLNRPSVALSQPTHDLELILERIEQDGLALHYRSFMQNFAHLFSLFLTPDQYERARASIDAGSALRFPMSDAGGPTLDELAHGRPAGRGWFQAAHRQGLGHVRQP